MADPESQGAPAAGAASLVTRDAGRGPADVESLLRLNNTLLILSNGAWYLVAPFIPLYLASQGASVSVVGIVIGVSGVMPLLLSIHAGALVDERGPMVVVKSSVILFALAAAVLTGLHGVWAVAVAYTLMGVANIGFAVAPQAIVAAASSPAARVRNYGYYGLYNSAGAVIGPIVGGFVAGHFGYTAAFALLGLLTLPTFAVAASMRGIPAVPRPAVSLATAHTLVGAIVRQPGVGALLFISSIVMCGQTLKQSFFPIYLHKVGLSATLIGMVVAADSLSSMVVRSFLSRGVAHLGYASLLLGGTALAGVALGVTPLLRQFWPLVFGSALMGASIGFTQPLTMSLMVEAVAAELLGVAFGIRQSVQRVAAIVSPIVFGLVITAFGIESGFYLGAATLVGAVPFMARMTGHLRRRPAS